MPCFIIAKKILLRGKIVMSQPSATDIKRPTDYFGLPLANILSTKLTSVTHQFDNRRFLKTIAKGCEGLSLTGRVELIADTLKQNLPADFPEAIRILHLIMGPQNPHQTGMFTNYYWLLPVAKYIEKYGLDHYDESMDAIAEVTKRNTGEYAIRPFIRKYPKQTLKQMKTWARSDNFHLRRLSSEGLRPKLPWASKLELFIENPKPVFDILRILKSDTIRFVQKSVANHITDYLKVNYEAAQAFITELRESKNEHTIWIVKHATRKHL
jgi:3-methyladenine DNA glycosylase AlkC